jgi:hypothetical protein
MTPRVVHAVLAAVILPFLPDVGQWRYPQAAASFLDTHLLVTWYGNPNSAAMGVLGRSAGAERARALRLQAAAYQPLTPKVVVGAYHVVAVVAQPTAGAGGKWRRRESMATIRALLAEARAEGFALVLDVQPGRSSVGEELEYLGPVLREPDVHLALDAEFNMGEGQVPGRELGHLHAADVNGALDFLERVIVAGRLPPKVLIVHQFTLDMLPDKEAIRASACVDVVLDMDGFGSPALKKATYAAVIAQRRLEFAGFKLFYEQDRNLLSPAEVMSLEPVPAVVIYQ